MTIRRFLLPSLALLPLVTGCNQFMTRPDDPPAQPEPELPAEPVQAQPDPEPPEEGEPASMREIIDMLQDGRLEAARTELERYLAKDPEAAMARGLLDQLEADPVAELGEHSREYRVQPGDTLGELAAKHLGDPLRFLILARYNDIQRSRDLSVGQIIEIPTRAEAEPRPEGDQKAAQKAARAAAVDHQARGMKALTNGNDARAYEAFKQALAIDPDLQPAGRQLRQLAPRLVTQYHERALAAYRSQQLELAVDLWDQALAIDPDYQPALGYRARALELKRRLDKLDEKTAKSGS